MKVRRKRTGSTAESFGLNPALPKKRPAETPETTVRTAFRKFLVLTNGTSGIKKTGRYESIRPREYSNRDTGFLSSKTTPSKAAAQTGKERMKRNTEYVIAGVVEGDTNMYTTPSAGRIRRIVASRLRYRRTIQYILDPFIKASWIEK